jgi:ABC-type uncharacterized transport system permease subunit
MAALGYLAIFRGRPNFLSRLSRLIFAGGLIVEFFYIVMRGLIVGRLPITSFPDTLTMVALLLGAVYLVLEIRQDTPATGVFVLPIVALLTLLGGVRMGLEYPAAKLPSSPWFAVHMISAMSSYCALSLAAVYGLLFLLLYHELKLGRFTLLYHRLPPLEQLGRMTLRSTLVGFVLLGIAIAVGMLGLNHELPGYRTDPNVVVTLFVWVVFGISIFAHYRWTSRGPLSVYLSLTGFAMLIVSAIMAVSFRSTFHRFH